jgi:hypothetical protein
MPLFPGNEGRIRAMLFDADGFKKKGGNREMIGKTGVS